MSQESDKPVQEASSISDLVNVVGLNVKRLNHAHEALLDGDNQWANALYDDALKLMELEEAFDAKPEVDERHPAIIALFKEAAIGAGYTRVVISPSYLRDRGQEGELEPLMGELERDPVKEEICRRIGEIYALKDKHDQFLKYMQGIRQVSREFLQNPQPK